MNHTMTDEPAIFVPGENEITPVESITNQRENEITPVESITNQREMTSTTITPEPSHPNKRRL